MIIHVKVESVHGNKFLFLKMQESRDGLDHLSKIQDIAPCRSSMYIKYHAKQCNISPVQILLLLHSCPPAGRTYFVQLPFVLQKGQYTYRAPICVNTCPWKTMIQIAEIWLKNWLTISYYMAIMCSDFWYVGCASLPHCQSSRGGWRQFYLGFHLVGSPQWDSELCSCMFFW